MSLGSIIKFIKLLLSRIGLCEEHPVHTLPQSPEKIMRKLFNTELIVLASHLNDVINVIV